MIDCSTLSSRCYVGAEEQAFCSLIWGFKWIVIPMTLILIGYFIVRKLKNKKH